MWTLLLKNQFEAYPASMSNNGILNVAEYRYFVHQLWSLLEGQLNEVLMVLFTAREEPAVSYR